MALHGTWHDLDGDGAVAGVDCDDADSTVNPWADEVCDEIDNDCDGDVDEGTLSSWVVDADGDGSGDEGAEPLQACSAPDGHVSGEIGDDCDDEDAGRRPGTLELCWDGIDNDCDGIIDESNVCAFSEVLGSTGGELFGVSVAQPADLDADGVSDLVVSAYPSGASEYRTSIWYGVPHLEQLRSDSADTRFSKLSSGYPGAFTYRDVAVTDAGDVPVLIVGNAGYSAFAGQAGGIVMIAQLPTDGNVNPAEDEGVVLLYGVSAGDNAGTTVVPVGDPLGTGRPHVAVGAPGVSVANAADAGAVYVVDATIATDMELDAATVTVLGVSEADNTGLSIAPQTDVDADGIFDLIVGTPQSDALAGAPWPRDTGRADVLLGPLSSAYSIDDFDGRIIGDHKGSGFGTAIATLDADSDGHEDYVFSSPAARTVFVVGASSLLEGEVSAADVASAKLSQPDGSELGEVLTVVDDLDGDGLQELVVRHKTAHDGYAMFIVEGPLSGTIELPDAATLSIDVQATSVTAVGDVDGDGLTDLALAYFGYEQPSYAEGMIGRVGLFSFAEP